MITIKSLNEMDEWLKKPGEKRRAVFFELVNNRRREYVFLKFAKLKGYMWINNDEIKPKEDNCGNFMSLNSEHTMGFVSGQIYMMGKTHEYFAYADTQIVINEMENYLTQVF